MSRRNIERDSFWDEDEPRDDDRDMSPEEEERFLEEMRAEEEAEKAAENTQVAEVTGTTGGSLWPNEVFQFELPTGAPQPTVIVTNEAAPIPSFDESEAPTVNGEELKDKSPSDYLVESIKRGGYITTYKSIPKPKYSAPPQPTTTKKAVKGSGAQGTFLAGTDPIGDYKTTVATSSIPSDPFAKDAKVKKKAFKSEEVYINFNELADELATNELRAKYGDKYSEVGMVEEWSELTNKYINIILKHERNEG